MLKIYHVKGTRAVRVIWLCEELKVPYEVQVIDFSPDYRNSSEWRSISPTGKVPAMTDGDLTMFESGAMADYVYEKYGNGELGGNLMTADGALCRQWCWFAEATFARPLGEIVNHNREAPSGQVVDFVIEDCKVRAKTCISAIEEVVSQSDYLVGNTFSMADIMNGYSLMLADNFEVLTEEFPSTRAYYERLGERPCFQIAKDAG